MAQRLATRVQLTTDGLKSYLIAVESAFGADVDYAQLVKLYGETAEPGPERKYSPSECIGTRCFDVSGQPKPEYISTSHVERQKLTTWIHMRRFTRLTNGFSKKFENHVHMVALDTVFYNFVKIHRAVRVTPAMEAGIAETPMSFEDIVGLIDAAAPKSGPRGPYRKQHK